MVVLRTYRIRVDPAKIAEYEAFEREEGMGLVAAQDGCLACGFGRVRESPDPTYIFYSLWETQKHIDAARANPTWKRVVKKLEEKGYSLGGDTSEHVDVVGQFVYHPASAPPPRR